MSEVKDTRAGSPSAEPAPPPPACQLFHQHAPETAAVACPLEDLQVWWGLSLTWGPAPTAPAPDSWHGGLPHPFLQVVLSLCLTSSLLAPSHWVYFQGTLCPKQKSSSSSPCSVSTEPSPTGLCQAALRLCLLLRLLLHHQAED